VSELKGKDLIFSFLEPIKGLGRQIASVSITRDYYDLSLSPDGKSIALVAEQEKIIRIVSTENGSVHSVSLKDWTWLQSVTWYTDGSRVYVNARSGGSWGILSVDLAGNVKVLVRALGGAAWLHGPIVSPDGYHLAYDERDFVSSVTMLENF
jgi:Tol biopolymer transport system component